MDSLYFGCQYFKVKLQCFPKIRIEILNDILKDRKKYTEKEDQGPVVQSITSLTSSLRGLLVKCFMTL